jgi:hypothetical protein
MSGVAAATNDTRPTGQIQAQGAMRIHIVHRDRTASTSRELLDADVSNPLDIFSQNISHPIACSERVNRSRRTSDKAMCLASER